MCLAEALLRIPDKATADRLIRDKIGKGDWRAHLGNSASLFVNAAAWGLVLTGNLVSSYSAQGLSAALTRLVAKGVGVAPLLLHTGVASLEASEPPYAEYFRVSLPTAHRINDTRRSGGRVIAIGTTVVRALESVVDDHGHVHPSEGWTETVVSPERPVRSIDGFLTGWHEPEASHLAMLEAIAGRPLLEASYAAALGEGYLWHEFGDVHLILP